MVTCTHAGSSGGQPSTPANRVRCHGRSWWCRITGHRARRAASTRAAAGFSGSEQTFATTTRSAPSRAAASSSGRGGPAASSARPGTSRSATPAPATVRTARPRRPNAAAQCPATTETPSAAPSRNETIATSGLTRRLRPAPAGSGHHLGADLAGQRLLGQLRGGDDGTPAAEGEEADRGPDLRQHAAGGELAGVGVPGELRGGDLVQVPPGRPPEVE